MSQLREQIKKEIGIMKEKSEIYLEEINTPFAPEDFGIKESGIKKIGMGLYIINGVYYEIENKHEARVILNCLGLKWKEEVKR